MSSRLSVARRAAVATGYNVPPAMNALASLPKSIRDIDNCATSVQGADGVIASGD
jgi:hypothetical protein